MSYSKKAIFSYLSDIGLFAFFAVFFAASFFVIGHFDSYTVTPLPADVSSSNDGSGRINASSASASPIGVTADVEKPTKESHAPYITDTRTVKEYKGKLGIYDCFGDLIGSFDTDISFLPAADRESLREGILFDSEDEMRNFLESLDS